MSSCPVVAVSLSSRSTVRCGAIPFRQRQRCSFHEPFHVGFRETLWLAFLEAYRKCFGNGNVCSENCGGEKKNGVDFKARTRLALVF